MRKIESKMDWVRLVDDIKETKIDEGSFGLSQNGDCIACNLVFRRCWNPYDGTFLKLKGTGGEGWLRGYGVIDALLIFYKLPLYIVDTGANYSWL